MREHTTAQEHIAGMFHLVILAAQSTGLGIMCGLPMQSRIPTIAPCLKRQRTNHISYSARDPLGMPSWTVKWTENRICQVEVAARAGALALICCLFSVTLLLAALHPFHFNTTRTELLKP